MKFRELIRLLENDGLAVVAQRGSHRQYEHPTKPGKVTVAGKPNADVPKGTAANILRQAGLRTSEEPIPEPTAVGATRVQDPAA